MTTIIRDIIDDTAASFFYMMFTSGINFHPDTPLEDYVNTNGERSFTDEQAVVLNGILDALFAACDVAGIDLYDNCLRAYAAANNNE